MSDPKRWTALAALAALLTLAGSALGDEARIKVEDLPTAVLKAVHAKYPEAKFRGALKDVEDDDTTYEVELTVDGKDVDLVINPEGEIQAVEKPIEVDDLPRAVLRSFKAVFPKGKIEKVEEITEGDDKVTYGLVIAIPGEKAVEVRFAPNGKILDDDKEEA